MSEDSKQPEVDAAKRASRRQFITGTVGGLVVGAVVGAAAGSQGFPKTITKTQTETSTTTQTSTQTIAPNLIVSIPTTWDYTADVVVIGSGGAGHAAALGALESGLSVIVLEKNSVVGGSTALSGGNEWVPGSPVQIAAGINRNPQDVLNYVNYIGGGEQDDNLIQVYLANAPSWIAHLQSITSIKFSPGGADQYEFAPGVLPNDGSDTTSPTGAGAAIIAALDPIIQQKGAQLFLNSRVTKIYQDATGAVLGVSAVGYVPPFVGSGVDGMLAVSSTTTTTATTTGSSTGVSWPSTATGKVINVKATKGVVIASGGFDWNKTMLLNFMRGPEDYAEGVLTNEGDGQMMGAACGAQLGNMNNVSGQTLYLVPNANGYQGVVNVEDRGAAGKPGAIIVNAYGNRFMDENLGGHIAFRALHMFSPTTESYINHPAFTIFDSVYQSYYAIAGIAAKAAVPSWVASSNTLAGLAAILGINATQLEATVATFNTYAATGVDLDFGRGSTILDQSGGDATRKLPNPCLGPISTPPYYALQYFPGMTGTVGGVKTNTSMQVVDWNNNPIPGLYAAGAASAGFWGEGFPGSGSNVGPALCMGWLTGKAIAGVMPSSTITWGSGAPVVSVSSTTSTTARTLGQPGY